MMFCLFSTTKRFPELWEKLIFHKRNINGIKIEVSLFKTPARVIGITNKGLLSFRKQYKRSKYRITSMIVLKFRSLSKSE